MRWSLLFVLTAFAVRGDIPYVETHDFGTVTDTVTVYHTFRIANPGSEPFAIDRAFSTCGCGTVYSFPESVPSGETGKLVVSLSAEDRGPTRAQIFVYPADRTEEPLLYLVTGTFEPKKLPRETDLEIRAQTAALVRRQTRSVDPQILMSPAEVDRIARGLVPGTIVDVRSPFEFQKAHIPSSINLVLHTLWTKGFLRGSPLVLAGTGSLYTEVEQEIARLRQHGFDAYVLSGGVAAWRRAGYRLAGTSGGGTVPDIVEPSDFFVEKQFSHWTVIYAGDERTDWRRILPYAIRWSDITGDFRADERSSSTHPVMYLVADSDGAGIDSLRADIEKRSLLDGGLVWFLKGGVEAYSQFLETQRALLYGRTTVEENSNPCASCR